MSRSVRRLYAMFEPQTYKLQLHPNKNTMSFTGTLQLSGRKTGRPAKRIVLHAQKLKITSAKLAHNARDGRHEIKVTRIVSHAGYEELR
ncbi:MAG: hypothetical protein ACREF7_04355, partial [Candidatus Saccharimonadales bacterium]